MFITDNQTPPVFVDSPNSFRVKELLWTTEKKSDDFLYQQTVCKVIRKPKKLVFHIQRIYLTYRLDRHEQLYAALADLLWVLDGKGLALSQRMFNATKSRLTALQIKAITAFFNQHNRVLLLGSQYSVCVTGIVNNKELVVKNSLATETEYDALTLAQDYIEYSQLDEALETLEHALLKTPERKDIEAELLDLLKLTHNTEAYSRISDIFVAKHYDLSSEWQKLAVFFRDK